MKKTFLLIAIAVFLLALPARTQTILLHEFAGGTDDGLSPYDGLLLSGSTLYGMTHEGGDNDLGTVFKIQADGSGFELLHEFAGGADDGQFPWGSLAISGTTLYGMTTSGGDANSGTIFKMEIDGSGYELLHEFAGGGNDGRGPRGALVVSGTTLYGMTAYGGDKDVGVVFKFDMGGGGIELLHEFTAGTTDGAYPYGTLVLSGTTLFGMTGSGGSYYKGTAFRIETNGSGYLRLHNFGAAGDGAYPQSQGALVLYGTALYGMTGSGGASDLGTIFKLETDGSSFGLLHEFSGEPNDGSWPYGSLILSGTTLYGMARNGGNLNCGTIFRIQPDGSGYELLHEFAGGADDGHYPYYGSLACSGTTLYGMTLYGGDSNDGVVFSLELPTVTVTAPNGGESWTAGTEQEITWTSTGAVGNVDILYTYDGGSSWASIAADTENDGSCPWLVPDTPSGNCYVQVLEHADGSPWDSSDAAFSIASPPASVNISGTVLWDSAPLAGVMMNGLPGSPLSDDLGFYTATVDYNWSGTVTPALATYAFTPASRAYANVTSDQTSQDYAATAVPSLQLVSPNGGEHWPLGETRSIAWTAAHYTGTVRLVLFKGGSRFGNIAANVPAAAGSYSWTVGQTYDGGMAPAGSDFRLYLRSSDGTLIDPSDYRFALTAPALQLQLTSPNGGESWKLGTTQSITWNANGYTGTVRLVLFNKATKIGQIVANIPASQESYSWTAGQHIGGTAPAGALYSIRLLAGDGSQEDYSDAPFELTN